jgi:predicted transcriptional regulator
MRTKIFITTALILTLFIGIPAMMTGQTMQQEEENEITEVSDREMEDFSEAYMNVQTIQQNLNEDINSLIETSDLSQESFQNMYQAHTTNNQELLSEMSDQEQESFSELMDEVNNLRNETQEDMVIEIEDTGLSVQRFNDIIAAIQQDSNLYKKFQDTMTD